MSEPQIAAALAALRDGKYEEARSLVAAFELTHELGLRHVLIKGLAEVALKNWQSAAQTFTQGTEKFPNEAQLWFNRGLAEENLQATKKAAHSFERALALNPNDPNTCGNLSNIYCALSRFGEAEQMARRALSLGALEAQALNSLGLALQRQYKFGEAESVFNRAAQLAPNDAFIRANLANLFIDQLQFEAAWKEFAHARRITDAAIIRHHEGMARLLAGDFEAGWKLCEARLEKPNALRLTPNCPRYENGSLTGKKFLILAEQGFGDTIQFSRFGKLLAKQDAEIVWVVPKNLQRLMSGNLPGVVITESDDLPKAYFYLPLMSLPFALKMGRPPQEPVLPYLKPPQATSLLSKSGLKIGLVWKGSPTHERDYERSIPLTKFAPLVNTISANFYAPFTGEALEQIADQKIERLDHHIRDFADTAALLLQLDYLITVDTAVAHLAGALGVPTYLLLPYCPDWRWGSVGRTTPWYTSLILLRQKHPGAWDEVIRQLVDDLSRKLP